MKYSWMRTFGIHSFNNSPVYPTAAWALVLLLYLACPVLTYLITGCLFLLTTFLQFPHPLALATTHLVSLSIFFFKGSTICEIIWYVFV